MGGSIDGGRTAPAFPDGVIVLAGGGGRRLGGVDKASVRVGSRTLLERALAAAGGRPTVVVGPARELPPGVWGAREDPPGGGPAAGVAAGFAVLREVLARAVGRGAAAEGDPDPAPDRMLVAVLAVDQPGVTAATVARLAAAVPGDRSTAGAVLVAGGRRQYTAGVFPAGALAAALAGRDDWHGVALRLLVDPLVGAEVMAEGDEANDVDTPADLARWRGAAPA